MVYDQLVIRSRSNMYFPPAGLQTVKQSGAGLGKICLTMGSTGVGTEDHIGKWCKCRLGTHRSPGRTPSLCRWYMSCQQHLGNVSEIRNNKNGGLTSTSANEAWANVDGVCEARFHVDRREVWEWTRLRLVVVCCGTVGAAAWVVALEEECARAGVCV